MATSVRMHRASPKYFIDLPPRTLITPKIIRTINSPDAVSCSSSPQQEAAGGEASSAKGGEEGKQFNGNQFAANQIVRHLWLGSHADSFCGDELRDHGIYNVLNVAVECITPETLKATDDGQAPIRVKHVLLQDHSDENIEAYFDECNAFIYDAIENRHEGVLVHCRMGVSRSATIVIAYLMEHGKRYLQNNVCQWGNLSSPLLLHDQADPFQGTCEVPLSCGVTPSTSTSTSTSSSPSIAADWLSYSEAFDVVKTARPEISPNLGFCIALRALDARHGNAKDDSWELECIRK